MKHFLKILLFFSVLLQTSQSWSQTEYIFQVQLKHKQDTEFSISSPEKFLSSKALARRNKYNIAIDSSDLPIPASYLSEILNRTKGKIHNTSRWFNYAVISVQDTTLLNGLFELDFVSNYQFITTNNNFNSSVIPPKSLFAKFDNTYYNSAWQQIALCEGQVLHEAGFEGQNITIAVLDADFAGVDTIAAFKALFTENRIVDYWNFISNQAHVFEQFDHGTEVLSCMAAALPDEFVGTAPQANYALYATDDYLNEPYTDVLNWVAAAERADSIGVDIINSSLGYNTFDDTLFDFSYSQLDGNTTLCAQAANIATQKGILVVAAAGNEGNKPWEYLLSPGDASNALTVGAVDYLGNVGNFSSKGPNAKGEVKPNVAAQGVSNSVISKNGNINFNSGTSLAAPIIAGLSACLLQANPNLHPLELIRLIESVSSQYQQPDFFQGYGIPDFSKALQSIGIKKQASVDDATFSLYPNPAEKYLHISTSNTAISSVNLKVYNLLGQVVHEKINIILPAKIDINFLFSGSYILLINQDNDTKKFHFVKH